MLNSYTILAHHKFILLLISLLLNLQPFMHDICTTMASADFQQQLVIPLVFDCANSNVIVGPPRVRHTSFSPCSRHIYATNLYWVGLRFMSETHPATNASYVIRVTRLGDLLAASFRSNLTNGTLAIR